MRKRLTVVLLLAAVSLVFGSFAPVPSQAQTGKTRAAKNIHLKGHIAKAKQGYVIRSMKGSAPSEIFTIVNPQPGTLDELVQSGKTVSIDARIVSGDNLEIERIDGKEYRRGGQ